MKFLIAVFLPASPYINFGDFCQPPFYSARPFYLKLASTVAASERNYLISELTN